MNDQTILVQNSFNHLVYRIYVYLGVKKKTHTNQQSSKFEKLRSLCCVINLKVPLVC